MPYAVELYFDEQTEALIKAIWEKLAEKGVSDRQAKRGARPHLALAVFITIENSRPPCEMAENSRKLIR